MVLHTSARFVVFDRSSGSPPSNGRDLDAPPQRRIRQSSRCVAKSISIRPRRIQHHLIDPLRLPEEELIDALRTISQGTQEPAQRTGFWQFREKIKPAKLSPVEPAPQRQDAQRKARYRETRDLRSVSMTYSSYQRLRDWQQANGHPGLSAAINALLQLATPPTAPPPCRHLDPRNVAPVARYEAATSTPDNHQGHRHGYHQVRLGRRTPHPRSKGLPRPRRREKVRSDVER